MKIHELISSEELDKILYADIFVLRARNSEQKKALRYQWLKDFLFSNFIFPEVKSCDVLFFRSMPRDDYKELFHTIIDASEVKNHIVIEDFVIPSSKINPSTSRYLLDNHEIGRKLKNIDPLGRSCCTIRLCYYFYILEHLNKINFETLVCFADMQPVEYLAAVYFKALGKKTITLQHGLYIDYGDLDTINIINYLHQPCEYFLSWGRNTANLIAKYHQDTKIVICGKPNIHNLGKNTIRPSSFRREYILVILDQQIFHVQNMKMLTIAVGYAKQHALDIGVRFHPHNIKKDYFEKFPSVVEENNFIDAKLVIGHTSSLIYEAMALGCNCIQFRSEIPTIPLNENLRFSNLVEFCHAAAMCQKTKSSDKINFFIECIGDESIKKYRAFFHELLSNTFYPKFSIVIPTYNSAHTITRCLQSLIAQSYSNFEILIIDGKSSDQTINLATSFAQSDARIRIFSESDKGTYDAMNKGLQLIRGEWVYFIGSDDVLSDNTVLMRVSEFIQQTNADFVYGNVKVVGDVKWTKNGTIYDGEFTTSKICSKNICHQAIFYRKYAFEKVGNFNIKYLVCADWDLNLRMWANFKSQYMDILVAIFNSGGTSTSATDPEFGKDIKSNMEAYFSKQQPSILSPTVNQENPKMPQKARLIAFYLPQFHPIPENDLAWGKGFTEWTNVTKATPLFPGHVQPKLPADLGFYDLRVEESLIQHANLAGEYGIEGFCYWHYWLGGGKRLLEMPVDRLLASGKPNFPFCLGWANHSWDAKGWMGGGGHSIAEQQYLGEEDAIKHFNFLLTAFRDQRYIRVNNKPLLVIYRVHEIPNCKAYLDFWRELARKNGFQDLYIIADKHDFKVSNESLGVDGSLYSGQRHLKSEVWEKQSPWEKLNQKFLKKVRYQNVIKHLLKPDGYRDGEFPIIIPNWDTTPRLGEDAMIFYDLTPTAFQLHVRQVLESVADRKLNENLVFIRSWNEWAEGNYLEPDLQFGKSMLERLKQEVEA